MGVLVRLSRCFLLDEANGEIQIILDIPEAPDGLGAVPGFGEANSPFRGRLATSEKKKDVLTVGVRGVLGPPNPRGVP